MNHSKKQADNYSMYESNAIQEYKSYLATVGQGELCGNLTIVPSCRYCQDCLFKHFDKNLGKNEKEMKYIRGKYQSLHPYKGLYYTIKHDFLMIDYGPDTYVLGFITDSYKPIPLSEEQKKIAVNEGLKLVE